MYQVSSSSNNNNSNIGTLFIGSANIFTTAISVALDKFVLGYKVFVTAGYVVPLIVFGAVFVFIILGFILTYVIATKVFR